MQTMKRKIILGVCTITVLFSAYISIVTKEKVEVEKMHVDELKQRVERLKASLEHLESEIQETESQILHDEKLGWIENNQELVKEIIQEVESEE